MKSLSNILKYCWIRQLPILRKSSTFAQHEVEVPTFCDINIDLPCNIRIKPLNVFKYHNCNKFIYQIDNKLTSAITSVIDGNRIYLTASGDDIDSEALCNIKAPVKANLNINGKNNIEIGYFQGDKLTAETSKGNIFVDRFQGNEIDVTSRNGNIVLNNYVQAGEIKAFTHSGSIKVGKLQGLNAELRTTCGDISIDSSYCHNNILIVDKGNMNLHNIHMDCTLHIGNGNLLLTGFDGTLQADLNGSAEVCLSRLNGNSVIYLKGNNSLHLKISEECLELSKFEIHSQNIKLDGNIKQKVKEIDNGVTLTPNHAHKASIIVNCVDGDVNVEDISWQEMIKKKLKIKP